MPLHMPQVYFHPSIEFLNTRLKTWAPFLELQGVPVAQVTRRSRIIITDCND